MSDLIELEKTDTVVQIALNRPEAYNAFNYDLVSQLTRHLTTLAGDDSVSGVVVTGAVKLQVSVSPEAIALPTKPPQLTWR